MKLEESGQATWDQEFQQADENYQAFLLLTKQWASSIEALCSAVVSGRSHVSRVDQLLFDHIATYKHEELWPGLDQNSRHNVMANMAKLLRKHKWMYRSMLSSYTITIPSRSIAS